MQEHRESQKAHPQAQGGNGMSEVAADYLVMPDEPATRQLAERCRRLERELREVMK